MTFCLTFISSSSSFSVTIQSFFFCFRSCLNLSWIRLSLWKLKNISTDKDLQIYSWNIRLLPKQNQNQLTVYNLWLTAAQNGQLLIYEGTWQDSGEILKAIWIRLKVKVTCLKSYVLQNCIKIEINKMQEISGNLNCLHLEKLTS